MSFLAWIVLGLIAGAIAKAIMPGNDPGGIIVTMIIGIVASLFTGVFCTRLVFDWWVRGAKVKRLSLGAEF